MLSPLLSPYVRRCCLSTLLLSPVGVRAAPLDARLRVLRVVPLVPLRALIPEDRRVRFIRRACVGCRQTVQVLPTFRASSRRRATELSFRGAVMVFLVFLEVLEMSLEVVGPGPNTREIKSLRVDPGPRACALPPDAGCMLPFGLFVVLCVGGFLQGRRLGGALSRPCSCSTRFNFLQAAGGIGATLLVVGEGPDVRLSRFALHR